MKKYKLLIDSPWGKSGKMVNLSEDGCLYYGDVPPGCPGYILGKFTPDRFPQIFEEIKEPSDEEVLAEKILTLQLSYKSDATLLNTGTLFSKVLARYLLSKGFDVSKLREGK